MSLRPAERADIPAMHRVRLAVRENRLSDPTRITEADYIAAMEVLGRTWVIEDGDAVVAFASGYYSGSVWALFVHPDHEGRGYGKTLHAVMIDWMWSLGSRAPVADDESRHTRRTLLLRAGLATARHGIGRRSSVSNWLHPDRPGR